ncbi:MAG: AAA domain-containing protein [Planctomycetes bacterium]|nr:AAA domain-containing protein [Planctomycetota bacterium]
MADNPTTQSQTDSPSSDIQLEGGTYEIIRNRLRKHADDLRGRLDRLNEARKAVFGAIETKLLSSERITTDNNCIPRDMITVGERFLFGYNVFIGLRSETRLEDVFAMVRRTEGRFAAEPLDAIADKAFLAEFRNLYQYYRGATFAKFAVLGPCLYMVFRVGRGAADIKAFKWRLTGDGGLEYADSRSTHEFVFPPQHEFAWTRATHDMHRSGACPHVSIEDRLFVETVGGDLTIKIEDNTATGEGVYSEPVDNADQTLDDAEIHYAVVGNLILLKIRPYQEEAYRHLVFNEKTQDVVRIDSIADACVLLPDGHGLIFPKGYYLQTGQQKLFNNDMEGMVFEKRLASPNGEDHLYVFYNPDSGQYVLLSYNVITQEVATPIACGGYCLFDDGTLMYFRAGDEPQRHHVIQIWQTPYCAADRLTAAPSDTYLFKIGNREIVRCMAECGELLTLLAKEDSYANLYVDLARRAEDIRDAYFWLGSAEAYDLAEPLGQIHAAAASAIEEYEKVVRTRQETARQIAAVDKRVGELLNRSKRDPLNDVDAYVALLADLRAVRGEVVTLRELRYVDAAKVEALDQQVAARTDELSAGCVEFLLQEDSLRPYHDRVEALDAEIPQAATAAAAREVAQAVAQTGRELEMLTEIVSNLRIDDATKTTAIIDGISLVYQRLNQVKSSLRNRLDELGRAEGQAEFASQTRLLDQAAANYLDVCDAPGKCDDYLARLMAQAETLEARFADFDEFILALTAKREELYNAFEGRKVQLVEQRNRRATALMTSAERILKGIANRVAAMDDLNAIGGYFAGDLMIERLRATIDQLEQLGDTVKAEDVRSRLKSIQQETVRQLKDRQALYEDGDNVIRLGEHRFAVNRQPLELTIVHRDGGLWFHLAGTGFFEPIADEAVESCRDVWGLEVISETPEVYRAEYLAWQFLAAARADGSLAGLAAAEPAALQERVRAFMAGRYAEGYVKGVHDADAAAIAAALVRMETTLGLLRYGPAERALATTFWGLWDDDSDGQKWRLKSRLAAMGHLRRLFDHAADGGRDIADLRGRLERFAQATRLFPVELCGTAAEYLFHELLAARPFAVSQRAVQLKGDFLRHLERQGFDATFRAALDAVGAEPAEAFRLRRDWVRAYLAGNGHADDADEVAALLDDEDAERTVIAAETTVELTGLVGSHPLIRDGRYTLDYLRFVGRLDRHQRVVAPAFARFQEAKKALTEQFARQLRLSEFEPRVLTTFVRNRLIDRVYLPLLGDNLAKQIGSAGAQKRTDRQGLLLLISPPGYGKTTLMEYIANRLGLIFMKINGPAVGHAVTSLDPDEAPNAAGRAELQKLNLAFEMGDNVMIYLDDIQHCSPELLQKFISLCDAQRRVEGVYKGRTRTYDLRGKRVCVVMAGNPYTESGETFRIPDMLANRADTYNIGDIVGDNYESFVDSYIENCLTSNPVLAPLAQRSQADVYSVMKLAGGASSDGIDFEGQYAPDELNQFVATMKKLFVVREVLLKVNQQYIRSAGQADEYRTEPPFLLQGSYRNMNRIAARVVAVMNDAELWTLILAAYEQDAQTLTTGAESNLLKFKEMVGRLRDDEKDRWEAIKATYRRRQLLGGSDEDKITQVIRQINALSGGLDTIGAALGKGREQFAGLAGGLEGIRAAVEKAAAAGRTDEGLAERLDEVVAAIRRQAALTAETARRHEALTINDNAQTLVAVLEEQFQMLETWLAPVERSVEGRAQYIGDLIERFQAMVEGYTQLIALLNRKRALPQAGEPRLGDPDAAPDEDRGV